MKRALLCAALAGCGATQVKVVGAGDPEYEQVERRPRPQAGHVHRDSTIELPSDEQIVEPDHPAVGTRQERALVHIHTPKGVCSGVVVGPRLVLTAHQCVAQDARGPTAMPADAAARLALEINTILRRPEIREKLGQQGWEIVAGGPEELRQRIADDLALWGPVIRDAKVPRQ